MQKMANIENLNTSNVNVNLKILRNTKNGAEFKYIQC